MNVQNISLAVGSGAAVTGPNPFADEEFWAEVVADKARTASLRDAPEIDLIAATGIDLPVRDQARRGTCIGFCTTACAEIALHAHTGENLQLSPEFLYWHLRQNPDPDNPVPMWDRGATKLQQAAVLLPVHGLCREKFAPYRPYMRHRVYQPCDPNPISRVPVTYEPSEAATRDAAGRLFEPVVSHDFLGQKPPVPLAELVHSELAAGRAVSVALPIFRLKCTDFDNWTNWTTSSTGKVISPFEAPDLVDRTSIKSAHAVCITGFHHDHTGETDGWFVFKNSWHWRFGKHGSASVKVPSRGYGLLSAKHVDVFAYEVLSLRVAAEARH